MSKFKVDNEQIDATAETLKTLLKECEDLYDKKIPESDVDKGQTHEELITVCDNIRTTCYYFGQLIHNTIEFLGKSSEMFAMSDTTSADAIRDDGGSTTSTGSSGTTHGGGGSSLGSTDNNASGEYQNKIANIIAQEKENISNCTAQKYWSWYYGNESNRSDGWCAVFASYMMEQAGVDVNAPLAESEWFKTSPAYQFDYLSQKGFIGQRANGYVPQVGDLVFYEGYGGGVGHVAIVTSIENGVVNTLHGNIGQPTIGEIPENGYRNAAEGGYCKILGYGNISAFAASQG